MANFSDVLEMLVASLDECSLWDMVSGKFDFSLLLFLTTGLDINFQGHLSRRTSEIENSPVLHEMTPVRTIIYVIITLIIDLSCRTSVIIIQPLRGATFQKFYLSGTVGRSLRSSPGQWIKNDIHIYISVCEKLYCIYIWKYIWWRKKTYIWVRSRRCGCLVTWLCYQR